MTEAEKAFKTAKQEINLAKSSYQSRLDLGSRVPNPLENIPRDIASLSNLKSLNLSNTQVADLRPIEKLENLKYLYLDNTPISDLSPIAGLQGLKYLYLDGTNIDDLRYTADLEGLEYLSVNNTRVSSLAPVRSLTSLKKVLFSRTEVSDLRPLLQCYGIAHDVNRQLQFTGTEAARRDPEVARLAKIQNFIDRTDQTIAYLKTLPPWPESLPWEVADTETHGAAPSEPSKPMPRPAPLNVAFIDGQLRELGSDTGLAVDAKEREKLGRTALTDYLDDFDEDQLARIENALPRLGKALARLRAALATEDAFNPIAAGMQGERVVRLAQDAPDRLMEDDREDVAQFAMQVSLYLDRFLVWKAYKDDATPKNVPIEEIAEALPEFEAVHHMLEVSDWSSPPVIEAYGTTVVDVEYMPGDLLMAKALQDTTREVLYEIVQEAVKEAAVVKKSGLWSQYLAECKAKAIKGVAGGTVLSVAGTGTMVLDAVFWNATLLAGLATRFPAAYPFVKEALKYLGLFA